MISCGLKLITGLPGVPAAASLDCVTSPKLLGRCLKKRLQLTNREDFIRVVPFDKWTANCDNRQAVFVRHGKSKYRVVFIDHHNCFNAGQWTFPDVPYYGTFDDRQIYQDVTGWPWFEPTLSRIEKISRFDLWKFATEIPLEWYQHDTAALSRLIERLYRRRSSVRDLVGKFRMSSINPFPLWKEN